MHIRAFAFLLFLTQFVLAQEPTPIVPDPKLTPGDTFDVTAQDVCVPGYNPPLPKPTPLRVPEAADTAGQVWVNTRSGKYWKPGSRYYGTTKQGQYMSKEEAVQKGYRPANT